MELDDHKGNIGHGAFEVFSMKIWNKRDALFSHEFSAFDLTRSLWRHSWHEIHKGSVLYR